MTKPNRTIAFLAAPTLIALLGCGADKTTAPGSMRSVVSADINGAASPFYQQHNLVSDGAVPADLRDPALGNAWGLVASATSPCGGAGNGADLYTPYNGNTR